MMDFEKEVLNAGVPVVAEFWAPWCGYCRRLAPALDRVEQALGDKARVVRINIDENGALAEKYAVDTIPTLILFQNGEAGQPFVNPPSQAAITEWLTQAGV